MLRVGTNSACAIQIKIFGFYLFTLCHVSSLKDGEEKRKPSGSPIKNFLLF
jgi:hypothetical protein